MIAARRLPPVSALPRFRVVLLASLGAGALAGALPALVGAAALAGLVALTATIASPVVGLAGLALALPLSPAGDELSRFPLAAGDALALAVLGSVGAARAVKGRASLTVTGAFWPGVLFIAVISVSAWVAADLANSAKEVVRWVEFLGILVVAATYGQRRSDRRLILAGVLVGLIAEAFLGWAQFLLRRGPDAFRIGPFLRAYGTFGQPNPYAGYLVMTLPLALALVVWLRPDRWLLRSAQPDAPQPRHPEAEEGRLMASPAGLVLLVLLALGASVVGTVALLMSLSRGALLGFAGSALVLVALATRRGATLILVGIVAVAAVFLLDAVQLVPAAISARLTQVSEYFGWFDAARVTPTPENWAVVERMAHWQAAWNMYLDRPILGVGPGRYAVVYPAYRVNDFWQDPLGHAHNLYLNLMAEMGFLGIVAYVVQWIAWVAVVGASFRRARQPEDRALASGVLASLIGVAIHNGFDNLLVHGLGTLTGLLLGLGAAIGREPMSREKQELE